MRKAMSVVAIAAASVFGGASAVGANTQSDHTVAKGDTLADLAGSDWGYACIVNKAERRIRDCDMLIPGQQIQLDITADERSRVDRLVAHWRAHELTTEPEHAFRFVSEPAEPAAPALEPATPASSVATTTDVPRSDGFAIPRDIVMCESGGDYGAVNHSNPNRPAGAYQITTSTWLAYGGGAYAPTADAATPAQQDEIAARIWAGGAGRHHWAC